MTATVDEFDVADPANAWTRAGFSVDADSVCRIGNVGILSGLPSNGSLHDVDSVPTTKSEALPATPGTHANGVTRSGRSALVPGRRSDTAWNYRSISTLIGRCTVGAEDASLAVHRSTTWAITWVRPACTCRNGAVHRHHQ